MPNLKTYNEWLAAGRAPMAGQRAEHYLVNADFSRRVAVFREDQTEPLRLRPEECTALVTADEVTNRPKQPRIKVQPWSVDGIAVWCGSNKACIKLLKSNHYSFYRELNRWVKRPVNIAGFAELMTSNGYRVDVEP